MSEKLIRSKVNCTEQQLKNFKCPFSDLMVGAFFVFPDPISDGKPGGLCCKESSVGYRIVENWSWSDIAKNTTLVMPCDIDIYFWPKGSAQ